jgi:hypothetical protein
MHANASHSIGQAGLPSVVHDDVLIDGRGMQRLGERLCRVILHKAQQWPIQILTMLGNLQVKGNEPQRGRGRLHVAHLVPFPADPEIGNALPLLNVLDSELAEFVAPDAVI